MFITAQPMLGVGVVAEEEASNQPGSKQGCFLPVAKHNDTMNDGHNLSTRHHNKQRSTYLPTLGVLQDIDY